MSTKIINFLFISFLLIGFFTKISSLENQNYNLSFELDENDLPGIEQFNEYFSKNNNEESLNENEYDDEEEYYSIESLEKSGKLNQYITENPDFFDDLSYVHNIDQINEIRKEKSKLNQMGETYKALVAKLLVHNALRNTHIEYEEEISF